MVNRFTSIAYIDTKNFVGTSFTNELKFPFRVNASQMSSSTNMGLSMHLGEHCFLSLWVDTSLPTTPNSSTLAASTLNLLFSCRSSGCSISLKLESISKWFIFLRVSECQLNYCISERFGPSKPSHCNDDWVQYHFYEKIKIIYIQDPKRYKKVFYNFKLTVVSAVYLFLS